jgi:DUF2075 family protein
VVSSLDAATFLSAGILGKRIDMGYYEEKKKELEDLLSTIKQEKARLENAARQERISLRQEQNNLDEKIARSTKLEEGVKQMARERQIGFPWLAKAYDELYRLQEHEITNFLRNKKRPAAVAAEVVKEQSRLRRQAERDKKVAQYLVEYYENIAPFLVDLKEEVDTATEQERELLKEYSEEELEDATTQYLSKEEYRELPSVERNQMALDRFWKRPKSKWLIGRLYERYVGYLYESQDYDVEYIGIFKGFEDLGRDLICQKGKDSIVIQCKNWAKFRTIYEKHIFQFFGTVFQYKDENPGRKIRAIFYTSTKLSELARRFASELGIELKEDFKFDKDYPSIKCHTSKADNPYAPRGTGIYHLPFDQQYDRTKLEKKCGEFYCKTVKEAEAAGFRRALRYRVKK